MSDNELARVGTPIEPRRRAEIQFGRDNSPTNIAPALVSSPEDGILRLPNMDFPTDSQRFIGRWQE